MKLAEVRALFEGRPHQRALQALQVGRELKKLPKVKGKIAPSIHEHKVGLASEVLHRLHGLADAGMPSGPGVMDSGLIETKAGTQPDILLTPRLRKQQARRAMKRDSGETLVDVAVRQLALGMLDPHAVSRLCSAYAYWEATRLTEPVIPILRKGLEGTRDQFEIAAHGLHKMGKPGQKYLAPYLGTAEDDKTNSPTNPPTPSMTVIVHGTFAKNEQWYRPGGDFHNYIRRNVFPDVYSGDPFFWSGRYSDSARRSAARKLKKWCDDHPTGLLRLIGHSHGANVVNLATRLGLQACTLIHLSPPVHAQYLPDMTQVSSQRFFTIRPTVDPVVWLDGGDQDYSGTSVASFERMRKSAWWGHSTSHEPQRWRNKNLGDFVRQVCT